MENSNDLVLVPQAKTSISTTAKKQNQVLERNEKRDGILGELLKYMSIRVGMTVKQSKYFS